MERTSTHGNMLSKEEIGRYSRQLLIPEVGVKGQSSILSTKVLIVGAGGLGCPVATYLAGAGVHAIGIVDYDTVSIDNLHRQVAHKESNVNIPKVDSLKQSIIELNHLVNVVTHNISLNKNNAMDVIKEYDIVADCSDNAATRYLVNDACVMLKKPLVSGSALRWEGQLTVYGYRSNGEQGPCYRCLYPKPPNASLITNCSEGGVLGPIVGIIGSMQALEVIKIASNLAPSYSGKLFLFDGLSGRSRCVALRPRNTSCDACGDDPSIRQLIDYEVFCGAGAHDKTPSLKVLSSEDRVNVEEYSVIREKSKPLLIDTRPPTEFNILSLEEAKNIPLSKLSKMDSDSIRKELGIENQEELFVICRRGNDSQLAVELLKEKMAPMIVKDIIGGYTSWSEKNPDFPIY